MKKRILSLCLIMSLVLCELAVFAASHEVQYAPDTYEIPMSRIEELDNATITGAGGVSLGAGGSVRFGLLPPFNISAITVYTDSAGGNAALQATIDGSTYSLSGNETYTFAHIIRKNDMNITISSNAAAVISKVELTREDLGFPTGTGITVAYGIDEELKLQTTAAMKIGSCAFLANNAVRYADYADAQTVVELIDGKMYAPVSAMALALSLYSEEIPEKGYALLRRDSSVEFCCAYDGAYYQINSGARVSIDNPAVYKNGTAYLPVRYIAELFGETVIYKDNIALIDSKYTVQSILEDDELFQYIKDTLAGFEKSSQGTTYYVAQTANAGDNNDGSESAPFKTLAKAGAVAQPGDTVIVGGGVYRETLKVEHDGEKAKPITFRAKEGEKPVISALDEVSGFTQSANTNLPAAAQGSVLEVSLADTLGEGRNMVFYNSSPLAEGRHPNSNTAKNGDLCDSLSLSSLWPTRGNLLLRLRTDEEKAANTKIYEIISETDLDQEANYWQGGTFVGLAGSGWSMSTAKIKASESGKLTIDEENCGGTWFSNRNESDNDFGYITNHIHTVDKPGEWFVDETEKKLYIYPPEGAAADSFTAEVKARQLVIDLEKNSYVNIEGIETVGGGIRMNDGSMNVLNGCTFRYISHYTYTADQRDGYLEDLNGRFNAEDNNAYAPQRGEMGIYIGGEDNVIANCTIDHSAGAAVYSTGAYSLIENNNMTDCGYMSSVVGGIFLSGKAWKQKDEKRGGDVIYYNTVSRVGRSCICYENQHDEDARPLTLCLPLDIGYNDLNNGMIAARDGGIVYTHALSLGSDSLKSKVHHNAVRNVWNAQSWGKSGVYNDNITTMQEVYDNLIFSENSIRMSEDVFQQPKNAGNPYWGVVDVWNNGIFSEQSGITLAGIDPTDYPGGKPFRIGSSLTSGQYTKNFELRNTGTGWYDCGDIGELSDAAVQDGMVVFSGDDAYVCYKNVDFGVKSNFLKIYFSGDCYNTGDTANVIIGSLDGTHKATAVFNANSPYPEGNAYTDIGIGDVSGVQDVYIKVTDYKSLAIRQIKPDYRSDQAAVKLYGGEYNDSQVLETNAVTLNPRQSGFDTSHFEETQTRYGVTLIYKGVEFPQDCDAAVWMASTSGNDSGSQVKIYIDENPYDTWSTKCNENDCKVTDWKECKNHKFTLDTEAAPYGELTITGSAWGTYKTEWSQMDKTITRGTHDVYIRFESWHCSDLYYIGFAGSVPESGE